MSYNATMLDAGRFVALAVGDDLFERLRGGWVLRASAGACPQVVEYAFEASRCASRREVAALQRGR